MTYEEMLTKLHAMNAEGRGDSEEAEALADDMDAAWRGLDNQEKANMRLKAACLNAAIVEEP